MKRTKTGLSRQRRREDETVAASNWQRLAQILPACLNRAPDQGPGLIFRLGRGWANLMGGPMAQHTFPLEIKNGILTVGVADNARLMEARFYRDDLKRKVAEFIAPAALKDIHFKLSVPDDDRLPPSTVAENCRCCGAKFSSPGRDRLCPICLAQGHRLNLNKIKQLLREAPWVSHAQAVRAIGRHEERDFDQARRQLIDKATQELKGMVQKRTKANYDLARQRVPFYVCLIWQKKPADISEKYLSEKLPTAFWQLYNKGGREVRREY